MYVISMERDRTTETGDLGPAISRIWMWMCWQISVESNMKSSLLTISEVLKTLWTATETQNFIRLTGVDSLGCVIELGNVQTCCISGGKGWIRTKMAHELERVDVICRAFWKLRKNSNDNLLFRKELYYGCLFYVQCAVIDGTNSY